MSDYATLIAERTVEVGDCLEWTGSYGTGTTKRVPLLKIGIDGKRINIIVPRLVWELANGPIPEGRIVYRHHCCNDRCVKRYHLKLGVLGDQLRRRKELGMSALSQSTRAAIARAARRNSPHTADQAAQVRDMAAAGVRDDQISAATGVGLASVSDIRRGRAWAETVSVGSVFAWRPAA